MKDKSKTLETLEKKFFEIYKIPTTYIDYGCGAEEDEDCPDNDIECKDCPYKCPELEDTKITDSNWVEFIRYFGNSAILRFPYDSTTEMKIHMLELLISGYKYPPLLEVVKSQFYSGL